MDEKQQGNNDLDRSLICSSNFNVNVWVIQMEREQKDLLIKVDNAITFLDSLVFLHKSKEQDDMSEMTKMIAGAAEAVKELRQSWLISIGEPQEISKETMEKVMTAVAGVIHQQIDNNNL